MSYNVDEMKLAWDILNEDKKNILVKGWPFNGCEVTLWHTMPHSLFTEIGELINDALALKESKPT